MFYDQSENDADESRLEFPGRGETNLPASDCDSGAFLAPSASRGGYDDLSLVAEDPAPRVGGYDRYVIESVWQNAETVPGTDPALWRRDEFGEWIYRFDYGRRHSRYGWEVYDPGIGRRTEGVYAMRPVQWESYLRLHQSFV